MITLRQILDSLTRLIKNSYFTFFFPFFLAGIGYLIIKDQKSLCYYISKPVSNNFHSVDGYYKTVKISLFNDGNTVIDNSDFLNEYGISIKNSEKIKFLKVQLIKKNRVELNIESKINLPDSSSLNIKLLKNEVFEQKDAITIMVYYLASNDGLWLIKSRIKGISGGISKGDINPREYAVVRTISIIWICLISILLFRFILFKIYRKTFIFRKAEVGLIGAYLLFSIILYIEYYRDFQIINSII